MSDQNKQHQLAKLAGLLESLKFSPELSKEQKRDAVVEYLGYIAGVCDTIIDTEKVPSTKYTHPSDLVKEAIERLRDVKNEMQKLN